MIVRRGGAALWVRWVRRRGGCGVVVVSRASLFVVLCREGSGLPFCLSEWGGAVKRMEVGRLLHLALCIL